MTHGHEVDLDLLADYVGGALDGTPEAATVERLIADDPVWSQAYAETSAAMDAVRVDLGALGADRDQMPADVLIRLEAALTPVLPEEGGEVVPFQPRRRWTRRFAPVAVAAGVLVCVALGASLLRPDSGAQDTATSSGAGDSGVAPGTAEPRFSAGERAPLSAQGGKGTPGPLSQQRDTSATPPILATGTDYTRATLPLLSTDKTRTGAKASAGDRAVPQELRRLTDPAALSACLAAISSEQGQPAGSAAQLVDLAQFEGSPAVVVLLTDRVSASGPDCGQNGPDTRYSARAQGR